MATISEKRCDSCYDMTPFNGPATCGRCRARKLRNKAIAGRRQFEPSEPPGPIPPAFLPLAEREALLQPRLAHARIHTHTVGDKPNPACDVCALWAEIVRLRVLCASLGAEPADVDPECPWTEYGPEIDPWHMSAVEPVR